MILLMRVMRWDEIYQHRLQGQELKDLGLEWNMHLSVEDSGKKYEYTILFG